MQKTKKQQLEEVLNMIEAMENNTFLLPDSWTELVQISSRNVSYKTYVSGRGPSNRYINIELFDADKPYDGCTLGIHIRKNKIFTEGDEVFGKRVKTDYVYEIIKDIYKDKHSFENHNEGERKIRKDITKAKTTIKQQKDFIKKLEAQLLDMKELTN